MDKKKFKYLIRDDINTFDFPENELDELGKEGWELGDTSLMSIIVVLKNLHNLIINQTKERKN